MWSVVGAVGQRSVVGGGGVPGTVGGALRVNGSALILDIGDEATLVVCPVGDDLDPAVRERDHELALHVAAGVLAL